MLKLKITHSKNLFCRALYMCGEDAVQPAVHPSSGCYVNQVQPGGETGLEHIRSTYEGKSEMSVAQHLIYNDVLILSLIFTCEGYTLVFLFLIISTLQETEVLKSWYDKTRKLVFGMPCLPSL